MATQLFKNGERISGGGVTINGDTFPTELVLVDTTTSELTVGQTNRILSTNTQDNFTFGPAGTGMFGGPGTAGQVTVVDNQSGRSIGLNYIGGTGATSSFGALPDEFIQFKSNGVGWVVISRAVRPGGSIHLNTGNSINFGVGANTPLAHYEEGTWTPTPSGTATQDGLSWEVSTGSNAFTRIGNLVLVQASLFDGFIQASTATGILAFTGLPFASLASATAGDVITGAFDFTNGLAEVGGTIRLRADGTFNFQKADGTYVTRPDVGDLVVQIRFSFTYITSA